MSEITSEETLAALDFLKRLYELKTTKNMTSLVKEFNMHNCATVVLLEKGILQKYRNNKLININTKGVNLEYRWKHPEIKPNLNTAASLLRAMNDTLIGYKANQRVKKKSVFIRSQQQLHKTPFYAELCKLREKYEKEMGVKITITAEITTTQKFDI